MRLLILTVQRTGGTTLTEAMRAVLAAGADHEPFLPARRWGKLTRDYVRSSNADELFERLLKVLPTTCVIKHCCELHDPRFNTVLIDAAAHLGYSIIVLFRANEAERLASRIFARRTGIFSRAQFLASRSSRDELNALMADLSPHDIDEAIAGSRTAVSALEAAVEHLRQGNQRFVTICYEDLFARRRFALSQFKELLADLGMCNRMSPEQRADVRRQFAESEQGSRELYASIPQWEVVRLKVDGAWNRLLPEGHSRFSLIRLWRRVRVEWQWRERLRPKCR